MIYILYSYISEDNHEKLVEEFLPEFSIDFQNRIKRYRKWQDAQLSLLGRVLLFGGVKQLGMNYEQSDIKYTQYKKPYFEDKTMQLNISHSGGIVVCALTDACDIGIDVELLNDIKIEDFKAQMTENEWSKVIGSSNKITSFYNYWTQKEAVIKADGKGLSIPLKSFEISQNKTIINGKSFFLKEIRLDAKYKCYISTETPITKESIKIIEWDSHIYSKPIFN